MLGRYRHGISLLVGSCLLLLVGVAVAAPTPRPTPSVDPHRATFGIGPASATKLDQRPFLRFAVTPGGVATDHVAVVNYSLRPLTLRIYATDALNDDKGGFALLPATKPAIAAGTWIAVGTPGGRGRVTVAPRSEAIVPVQVRIPMSASPGDAAAGIVASLQSVSRNDKGVNVRLDQRVATRIYFRVSGAIRPQLTVTVLRATYHDNGNPLGRGSADITYRVTNTGNVKLGGKPLIRVRGWFGTSSLGPRQADIPLLFPGSSVDRRTTVSGVLPTFLESASVSITPVMLQGDVDPGLHVYSGSRGFWAVPWVLLAILLLFGYFLRRLVRRRMHPTAPRHAKGGPPGPSPASVAPGSEAHVVPVEEGAR